VRRLTGAAFAVLGLLAAGAAAGDGKPSVHAMGDAPLLAGLMACPPAVEARWPWSGAWVFPVGDSLDFERAARGLPAYQVNRGVIPHGDDGSGHDGADIANGRFGGRVRAAANGLVVCVKRRSLGGYGAHIVIAHHLDDGSLAYTVYAHLSTRSLRVRAGTMVSAGDPIARVGQTGRATTPHLHFEVRIPQDSTLRWELCPVVDPVAFVRDRLPTARPDSDWAAPYLAWAEFAGLVPPGLDSSRPLDPSLLARALERAGSRAGDTAAVADAKHRSPAERRDAAGWNAIARGLTTLGASPVRLRPCPIEPRRYGQTCQKHLGVRRPARELRRLAGRDEPATIAELCLALADFAPRPPRRRGSSPERLAAMR
jgi:hypothetical protein